MMTSLVPTRHQTTSRATLFQFKKKISILAQDDEKEQMRCWLRETKKKIRNLIMRDHGYLVSKGEGGLLSDYHCHAAVVALQNTTYTHTDVLKKKRQKNRTISQFETDILIGGLNLFQWGKCV